MRGDERLIGADVCFYKGVRSENPMVALASTDDIRCVSADAIIDVPSGMWNYYLIEKNAGYVSAYPDILIAEGDSPRSFRQAVSHMRRAAVLDVTELKASLVPGQFVAMYISNTTTDGALAIIRPVPRDSTRVLVPADEAVVPLVVSSGRIVRIGNVLRGSSEGVQALGVISPPAAGRADIGSWIKIDYEPLDALNEDVELGVPVVSATADAHVYEPLLPLREGLVNELSLVIFKNVPRGSATIRLSGETWETTELDVFAETAGATWTQTPLRAVPASRVAVDWSISGTVPNFVGCDQPKSEEQRSQVVILNCAGASETTPRERLALHACQTVAAEDLNPQSRVGSVVFSGLPIRMYVAALKFGKWTTAITPFHARPGKRSPLALHAQIDSVYGRITRGGEPIRGEISFTTGAGASDQAGDYVAIVDEAPRGDAIEVRPCGESDSVTIYPAEPVEVNSRTDVVLPDTRVTITVRDASDGAQIRGASLTMTVYEEGSTSVVSHAKVLQATDEKGTRTTRSVPLDRVLRICAEHEGFQSSCTSPFSLTDSKAAREFDITLQRVRSRTGKILGPRAIESGIFFLLGADGQPAEMISVKPDGSFEVQGGDDSVAAILIANNYPLHVFRSIPQDLQFNVGMQPSRSFSVESASQDLALVGITVDGVRVPSEVLDRYQSIRGLPTMIINREAMLIGDVASSIAIDVTLGPHPGMIPADVRARDWFLTPTFAAAFPTKRVDSSRIVF